MALVKIADYYPNYKEKIFGGDDIKGFSVYTDRDEKVGDVHDALLNEFGRFRYLVIDTGFWILGKKVLLPVGRARFDYNQHRVYVTGMTKEHAENLPEYKDDMTVDYDHEERVRNVYRPTVATTGTTSAQVNRPTYNRDTYKYDYDPSLYETSEQNHQKLKLYEEKLVVNKERYKAGEVAVGKRVETKTAKVSVPVEQERVVIERTTPTNTEAVTPGSTDFQSGEVARIEVYEESADIQKKTFVREEATIKKEAKRDTVDATEKVRHEELEVDADGKQIVHKN